MVKDITSPVAIQLKTVYLPSSETYIYRHLARFERWSPYVFAELLTRLDQFPLTSVYRLPRPSIIRRLPFALARQLFQHGLRAPFRMSSELSDAAHRAKVMHAHFGESGRAALSIRRTTGLPLITSFHGRDVAQPVRQPGGRNVYRRLFQEGAAFTAVSHVMRAQLIQLGAPAERVHVIRTGVDLSEITYLPRSYPSEGLIRLLTCGRLVEKKGTRYAIEALARLRATCSDISLTVVGDGPLRASLQRFAEACGVARCVTFLGSQPVERVLSEMAAAHIFVLPCVTAADGDQEGVPVVLMEAQAAGVPVISTWHAGVPEVVRDGMSGYLVPERDIDALVLALQRLIERHEQWPTMGLEGRAHMIAEFDVNQAAADVERLYDRVVERH